MKAGEMQNNREKIPVSLCMIAKNVAAHLARCFEHIGAVVDEMLVLDTGSSDKTREAAAELGACVFTYAWNGNFSSARNVLLSKARNDWVLWIDGDEYYPPELVSEIREAVSSDCAGCYIPRRNYYLGKWLKHGGNYPDYQLKLFRKSLTSGYTGRIHERVELEGRVVYLEHECEHHPYPTVESYLVKFDEYTTLEAKKLLEQGTDVSAFTTLKWMLFIPAGRFTKRYFLKRGFLDGFPGFFAALFDALGFVVRYVKLWELTLRSRDTGHSPGAQEQ